MTSRGGYTLIELMVVLLIMAILAAVAFPTYQATMLKSKRVEGRAALMQLMQQQERYYLLHTTYLSFSAQVSEQHSAGFKWYSGATAKTSAYEISAHACDDSGIRHCVRLVAQPGTIRVDASYQDRMCGALSLDSKGVRAADADNCW